jgi:hypothetical protein
MANYRNIVDVDVLDKASEATNVLVEEGGSLKKMAMANMGGGNGSVAFIKHTESDWLEDGTYNFVNPENHSVIEPATNNKVQQAIKNGIVYAVQGSPGNYGLSQIFMTYYNPNESIYATAVFGGCGGLGLTGFSIYDE